MKPIIRVENLSKQYTIGTRPASYGTLRDSLTGWLRNPFARNGPAEDNTIWALRDVSFDVMPGEVLGIIGRNGAGKSTLLKILSRIVEPTTGKVDLYGRVGSLLEVGTGFHSELSGRENIYLNGAILGMKRSEIDRKFDEIVDFAEIEKFIDTPVKHYSSGMYMRLAFAVAAHLEPEILIVDEVLAVGDIEFQKKCLQKMGSVAAEGRTVIFVSHNIAAIRGLCSKALLLKKGELVLTADVDSVLRDYLTDISRLKTSTARFIHRYRGKLISIDSVELVVDGLPVSHVQAGHRCKIQVHYRSITPQAAGSRMSVSIMLFSEGQKLVNLWTNYHRGMTMPVLPKGIVECEILKWPFRSSSIRVDVFTEIRSEVQEWIEECLFFNSFDGDYYGSGIITNADQGIMFLDHIWHSGAIGELPISDAAASVEIK